MVKLLGLVLIATSLLTFFVAAFIDAKYVSAPPITGNLISNMAGQPIASATPAYYAEAIVFSYSILSLIMGMVFIFGF